jgi:hypothetical protein
MSVGPVVFISESPATDDTEMRVNYPCLETITFFAKEAPFVASVREFMRKREGT